MKKIKHISIPSGNLSATITNAISNRFLITPSIPIQFDAWAYSFDNELYHVVTHSNSEMVAFDSSAQGNQTIYLRGVKIESGEEILDSLTIEKTVTLSSGLSGKALFFNGGYAYTMPSKPNGSYSQSEGGGLSGYVMQPQYGTQAHIQYSDLKFYVNGSQVGSKTIRMMRDNRYSAMMIGSWHATYSNGYDTGHTRPGASGVNYNQFWRAIPSAHSNTNSRFYGLMRELLSIENSVPNATQVNTLYQDGLEGLLDSGYNPVRTYWEMDEVKTNGTVHGLTLGQYVNGVTAGRGSNYNKASKIVLSSGIKGI